MTRMLASIATPEEAEIALAGGADVIDLKNTTASSFGAVANEVIRATVATVNSRRLVSASAGNLAMQPDLVVTAVREIAAAQVDIINVGIFPRPDTAACITALTGLTHQVKLIAVFFADTKPDLSLLPLLARSGFVGAMFDTAAKTAGSLLDRCDMPALSDFVERCHAAGLLAGLAGSLETPDIPRLLVLAPDLLGFHAALRRPGAELDPARLRAVRGLIPQEQPAAGMRDVDYRLLGTRSAATAGEDAPTDLVFVEDLVLPVFIGAYTRERDTPQNVRFAVSASVMRAGRAAEDMRDVFSYDLITDGIRMLVGSGHVALVETLAERIAAMVLGHPRVTKVVVRVEKLDTGSGTVGVEIERKRKTVRIIDRPVVPLLVDTPKGASGIGTKS